MSLIKRSVRFKVLAACGFRCRYCGRSAPEVELEVDHVTPKSKGGRNTKDNLVAACFDCNRGKRDKLIGVDSPDRCDYMYCSDGCERCWDLFVLPLRVEVIADKVVHHSAGLKNDRLHAWYRCSRCHHQWATSWSLSMAKIQHESSLRELIKRGHEAICSEQDRYLGAQP